MKHVVAMAILVALSGCTLPDPDDSSTPPSTETEDKRPGGRQVPTASAYLLLELDSQPWRFTMRVWNPTNQSIYAHEWGCGSHVMVHINNSTHGMWQTGAHPRIACGQALPTEVAPGTTLKVQAEWNGTLIDWEAGTFMPAPAGTYNVSMYAKWVPADYQSSYSHITEAVVSWPGPQ